jgi:hypothetical protein
MVILENQTGPFGTAPRLTLGADEAEFSLTGHPPHLLVESRKKGSLIGRMGPFDDKTVILVSCAFHLFMMR